MQEHIAIIGSGIAGLTAANLLSEKYKVSLFEANDYLGGHTNTQSVNFEDQEYHIDTGFIVFNKKTYPNFCKLLEKNSIAIQPSEMSFSYRSDQYDFEYNGHSLNSLFCDRRNLYRPRFYRFIRQILKFNKEAKLFLKNNSDRTISMHDYIHQNNYSEDFINSYLLPMISSIWSMKKSDVLNSEAHYILSFYANHGLLDYYQRPQWYVLKNGSNNYIKPLIKNLKGSIYLNTQINQVERRSSGIILRTKSDEFNFGKVIIASHSDQALNMLVNPSPNESKILSAIKYTDNEVTLHTDSSIMPKSKLGWASWNFFDNGTGMPTLTYYMNRLQSIKSPEPFFVSVNLNHEIDQKKIIQKFRYSHPCLNSTATNAQKCSDQINGINGIYYVGSYWGHGFHEDGVNSAIRTCQLLGINHD